MIPIVLELQQLASDGDCSIDRLLRKALMVATKLQLSDSAKWIESELDGYDKNNEIPNYRYAPTTLKIINPANGMHMPLFSEDTDFTDQFSHRHIQNPIAEICSLLASESSHFKIGLPSQTQLKISELCDLPVPMESYLQLSRNTAVAIVDAVRNCVLKWSLQLEQDGILGEGMSFTIEEKKAAKANLHNIHITNFQGILGDVSDSKVQQSLKMQVFPGNFESLQEQLVKAGITMTDIQQLKTAIESDPKPTSSSAFGTQTSSWIGTMMSKAARGTWKISLEVACKLIPSALNCYFGLDHQS